MQKDEYLDVTPQSAGLRKIHLTENFDPFSPLAHAGQSRRSIANAPNGR
jgi:hypothetical protein